MALKPTTYTIGGRLNALEHSQKSVPVISNHVRIYDDLQTKMLSSVQGVDPANTHGPIPADSFIPNGADEATAKTLLDRRVGWFMLGNGGADLSMAPGEKYIPRDYESVLYQPIPIRLITTAIYNSWDAGTKDTFNDSYKIKIPMTIGGTDYFAFYAKSLSVGDIDLVTGTELDEGAPAYTPVPGDTTPLLATETATTVMTMFSKHTVNIGKDDCKEWYLATEGDLSKARFNEIGLIMANEVDIDENGDQTYMRPELKDAELAMKMTTGTHPLENPDAQFQVYIYDTM